MVEITTTRHNPMVDPVLSVWGWEIPVYLFVGGLVAGMMILAGINMLRTARGEDTQRFFSLQTPILGIVLLSLGMAALFLDLEHQLYVWAVYLAFEPLSPMSWGSWILLLVYPVLAVSALIRLDEAWPWLGARVPVLKRLSDAILAKPALLRLLGGVNIVLGVGLGIYTGILLNTMVARPLWNSAILGPLFLVSGLSAAAAMVHLASSVLPGRPAPRGLVGGAFASLVQTFGTAYPAKGTVDQVIRADLVFLVVELVLIALLIIGLLSSTESHIASVGLLMSGKFGVLFWGVVVGVGILLPLAWQWLEVNHRIPHTVLPALLVLAGGFVLRWVMVNAGQASEIVQTAGVLP
jgi:formate-dependent nitrite reductase membrane component NrfD